MLKCVFIDIPPQKTAKVGYKANLSLYEKILFKNCFRSATSQLSFHKDVRVLALEVQEILPATPPKLRRHVGMWGNAANQKNNVRIATTGQQRCTVNLSAAAIPRPQVATKNIQRRHHQHHFDFGTKYSSSRCCCCSRARPTRAAAPAHSAPSTPGAPTCRKWRRVAPPTAAAVAAATAVW